MNVIKGCEPTFHVERDKFIMDRRKFILSLQSPRSFKNIARGFYFDGIVKRLAGIFRLF